jgi:hypothetical protein
MPRITGVTVSIVNREESVSVLDEFLHGVQPEHREIIRDLDALIREVAPDLVASLKWGNLTYSATRNACALVNHARYVNLQIWGGASVPDPSHLLQGTGVAMRHAKFVAQEKFDRQAVAAIVQQAAEAARS